MSITYNELNVWLSERRIELLRIIKEINSGNKKAVEQLDHNVFNEQNRELFLLNAIFVEHERRYSGKPSFIHPASAAMLFSYVHPLICGNNSNIENNLSTENNQSIENSSSTGVSNDTKQKELRDRTIGYILTHDLLEDGLDYDLIKFNALRDRLGNRFEEALDAAVLLCPPHDKFIYPPYKKIATVLQVQEYGTIAHAYALISDKLDYSLDLEYIHRNDDAIKEEIRKGNNHRKISHWFISYPRFCMELMMQKIPEMKIIAEIVLEGVRCEYNIPEEMVNSDVEEWNRRLSEGENVIKQVSKRYLADYGFLKETTTKQISLTDKAISILHKLNPF